MSGGHAIYVGIDPGAKGALAISTPSGYEVFNFASKHNDGPADTASVRRIKRLAEVYNCEVVVMLEEVGGFIAGRPAPGSAMFNFGTSFGRLQGALEMADIGYRLVRPQVWQKGISRVAGLQGADRKRALQAEALRLYPALKPTLATCDAILLMDYAKRFTA